MIQGAIRLSAHVLTHDKSQLQSQLYGRLLSQKSTRIIDLLKKIEEWKLKPWLRPLNPSLIQSGGPLLRTLVGHRYSITGVAMSEDGQIAVSASLDGTLKVWNLIRGIESITLMGHTDAIRAVAITPDGRLAVSASSDKTLKVWDIEHGKELITLKGHTTSVRAVSITPDGNIAISASFDGTIKIWDLKIGS
jgi:WD40 repeat protein